MSALCQKRLSKHEKLVGDYEFLIDRKLFSSTSTYRLRAIVIFLLSLHQTLLKQRMRESVSG